MCNCTLQIHDIDLYYMELVFVPYGNQILLQDSNLPHKDSTQEALERLFLSHYKARTKLCKGS